MPKKRILWVEDDRGDMEELWGPVFASGRYDLEFALDVSEAVDRIRRTTFQGLILDIRLPPGSSNEWIELYNSHGSTPASARLGLELANSLRRSPDACVELTDLEGWVKTCPMAFLSVESRSEVEHRFNHLGAVHYQEKSTSRPFAMLDLLRSIFSAS